MDHSRDTGQLLERERRSLAESVVSRQYQLQPELRSRYGEDGREKCIQDTEYHLSYLAVAVQFASPSLFAEYFAWVKPVMVAYGVNLEDVDRNLVCLRDVLQKRLSSEGWQVTSPYIEGAFQNLQNAPSSLDSFLTGEDELAELARAYLQAVLNTARHEAIRLVLDAVRNGIAVQDIYTRVFQPCQREVGRLWQMRQITVAQEHYCTAATQLAMSQLYPFIFSQVRKGRRLVATSVSGELHEMGLRIVTDLFEADGWDTMYLGASVPEQSILQAIEQYRPDLLLISATMTFHLPAAEQLISLVRSADAGRNVKIMVGGYPCNIDRAVWARVGADGYACDALEAMVEADRLLGIAASVPESLSSAVERNEAARPAGPPSTGEAAMYNELSRLNNELITAQRELARKNAELERLSSRLIEEHQNKDRFLATLAHEMRNPLAPITSGLELLRIAAGDKTLLEEVRSMMERQVRHLSQLVDDLLDVSRIKSGKITLRKIRVELSTIVQIAVEATRPLIDGAGHELIIDLPPEVILVEADPTRLAQVISNLLTNAARYTEHGGKIWLTAARDREYAIVTVRDTGVGIPADKLEMIFEMYSQVDGSLERSQGGLGIGLMLVKRLTELHGGAVQARSAGRGQGSEFIVKAPIVIDQLQTLPADDEGLCQSGGLRVLVVDDHEEAASTLALMLKTLGNDVRTAGDGLQAVQLAEEFGPDIVLMDLGMPRLDGYEAARRIRAEPWGQRMILAALSGLGQAADSQRTSQAGFDQHLVKPIELSVLNELLRAVKAAQQGP